GTVNYMSPEQLRKLRVDSRTDIWSLGVVVYEMLAGRLPFVGETPSDVMASILERDPPKLDGVPAELARIVTRCLAKDVDKRYSDVNELLDEIQRLTAPPTQDARPPGILGSTTRASWLATALVVAVVLAVGYFVLNGLRRSAPATAGSMRIASLTARGD